jgi:hypothetical protein
MTPRRAVSAAQPTAPSADQSRAARGVTRLEVRHAVDARRDPFAVERHLARDLGVKTLRRIQERGGAQPDEVEADRNESDAERDAAHRSS